jgi:hypothetical protein
VNCICARGLVGCPKNLRQSRSRAVANKGVSGEECVSQKLQFVGQRQANPLNRLGLMRRDLRGGEDGGKRPARRQGTVTGFGLRDFEGEKIVVKAQDPQCGASKARSLVPRPRLCSGIAAAPPPAIKLTITDPHQPKIHLNCRRAFAGFRRQLQNRRQPKTAKSQSGPYVALAVGSCFALGPSRDDEQGHADSYRHFDKPVQRGNPCGLLVRRQDHNREGNARKAISATIQPQQRAYQPKHKDAERVHNRTRTEIRGRQRSGGCSKRSPNKTLPGGRQRGTEGRLHDNKRRDCGQGGSGRREGGKMVPLGTAADPG